MLGNEDGHRGDIDGGSRSGILHLIHSVGDNALLSGPWIARGDRILARLEGGGCRGAEEGVEIIIAI